MLAFVLWGAFFLAGVTRHPLKSTTIVAAAASIALTGLGILFLYANDVCSGGWDCSVTPSGFAINALLKFVIAMVCYGLGRAAAGIAAKFK